jgi:hypothetical protein
MSISESIFLKVVFPPMIKVVVLVVLCILVQEVKRLDANDIGGASVKLTSQTGRNRQSYHPESKTQADSIRRHHHPLEQLQVLDPSPDHLPSPTKSRFHLPLL